MKFDSRKLTLLNLIKNNKNKNLIILKSRNAGYQDIQKQLYEELKGKNKQ